MFCAKCRGNGSYLYKSRVKLYAVRLSHRCTDCGAPILKTNQHYREAMGLPQRYDEQSYEGRLDYGQISRHHVTATGSREEWMKEEMMAYLDWSNAEDERIEAQVAQEMNDHPLANKGWVIKEIWQRIETDYNEQQALHSANCVMKKDCIVVRL
ncbi:hypothetical protein MGU_10991 [Metarhizium guizhouense ARSEF 977]|uniref:Uncharacterized protein n=1 Tax=Metarhizium guizhouense (strain ARSEF 977) TaxID=1276136 RepID=A0A0B4HQE2_METGA|nr:hypothetical protein MGU_10991 [Metarhizium guizhouense ARSEF 977]